MRPLFVQFDKYEMHKGLLFCYRSRGGEGRAAAGRAAGRRAAAGTDCFRALNIRSGEIPKMAENSYTRAQNCPNKVSFLRPVMFWNVLSFCGISRSGYCGQKQPVPAAALLPAALPAAARPYPPPEMLPIFYRHRQCQSFYFIRVNTVLHSD